MIIYFTGTGNSRFAARETAKYLNDEVFDSFLSIKNGCGKSFESKKPYVFVCPTYAYKIPRIFESFIRKSKFSGNKKAYFIMTCGSYIGAAQKHLEKLCSEMQLDFMGVCALTMPENYICMFDSPSDEEAELIIKKAIPVIEKSSNLIAEEKAFKTVRGSEFMTYVVNPVFYKLFVKDRKFYATHNCTGCGRCEKLCPMNNIKVVDKKPVWNGNCTHCQACICACPAEAVEYGKTALGKNRYYLK